MDELAHGTRNKRGDHAPNGRLEGAPLFVWPPKPLKLIAWAPRYFLPWSALFFAFGAVLWVHATPAKETLDWHWLDWLLARNAAIVFTLYGALKAHLHIRRAQGNRFKFNAIFPADKRWDVFLFGSQNVDNVIRSFGTSVPIWTGYEVVMRHL